MKCFLTGVLLGVVGVSAAFAMPTAPNVKLVDARFSPASVGASVALRALIVNETSATVVLDKVECPLARVVEMSDYVKDSNGFLKQQELPFLPLPAGKSVVIVPGSREIRLLDLSAPLERGLEVPVTFVFEGGMSRVYRVKVEE